MAKKTKQPAAHVKWLGEAANIPGFDGSELGGAAHLEPGRVYRLDQLPANFSHTLALPCEADGSLLPPEPEQEQAADPSEVQV